jgi:triphosphoribosyl-dephospho-CoA synthase
MPKPPTPLSIAACVNLACLYEATAPKPGNVHRGADFEDLTYVDLLVSAAVIAPILDNAGQKPLGKTVLSAVKATQLAVNTNSNLGIVLLLTPLALASTRDAPITAGIGLVLDDLQPQDAADVYEAIRLAKPDGLGSRDEADVAEPPSISLVDAMRLAADRDLVARQYATDFAEVLGFVLPAITTALARGATLGQSIVEAHLRSMAEHPDSLIARKCGADLARQAADWAAEVLKQGTPGDETFRRALADFDFWLRSDGNRRNPGSTADLIAAALFVGLREGSIDPATPFYPAC